MYGIMRLQKFRRPAVYGIEQERCRDKDTKREFAYSDIDKDQTSFNVVLRSPEGKELGGGNFNKRISQKIKDYGCRERKDSVVMIGAVFTASQEMFKQNPNYIPRDKTFFDFRTDEQKQRWLQDKNTMSYFQDCLDLYVKEFCGGDYSRVLDARIDFDETTPHMQVYSVPIVETEKGNKLCAKEIFGNRTDLRQKQDLFHEKIGKAYGLERGEKVEWDLSTGEIRKHKETQKYKREKAKQIEQYIEKGTKEVNRLKVEINDSRSEKDALESQNKGLKADNIKLSECRKKGIEKVNSLVKEVNNKKAEIEALKAENANLRAENARLVENNELAEKKVVEAQKKVAEAENAVLSVSNELDNMKSKKKKLNADLGDLKARTLSEVYKQEEIIKQEVKDLPGRDAFGRKRKKEYPGGVYYDIPKSEFEKLENKVENIHYKLDKLSEYDFAGKEAVKELQDMLANEKSYISQEAEELANKILSKDLERMKANEEKERELKDKEGKLLVIAKNLKAEKEDFKKAVEDKAMGYLEEVAFTDLYYAEDRFLEFIADRFKTDVEQIYKDFQMEEKARRILVQRAIREDYER